MEMQWKSAISKCLRVLDFLRFRFGLMSVAAGWSGSHWLLSTTLGFFKKKIFEKCLRPRLVRLVGRATSYRTTLHICWQSQVNDNDVDAARSLCCRRRHHQFSDENEDHRDDDGQDILANTTKIWPSDFWFCSFSLFEAANDIPAQKKTYICHCIAEKIRQM